MLLHKVTVVVHSDMSFLPNDSAANFVGDHLIISHSPSFNLIAKYLKYNWNVSER